MQNGLIDNAQGYTYRTETTRKAAVRMSDNSPPPAVALNN